MILWHAVMVEVGTSKGQKVLPLPMGWQQGKALGRDAPDTPRSSVNDDVAALEASVVTWRHLLQNLLSATPQAAIKVCNDSTAEHEYLQSPVELRDSLSLYAA